MNKRFLSSYKIAIGFVIIALMGVYGYKFANDMLLGREHFPALQPGTVDIVGLDKAAGYGIIVSNGIAKLVIGTPEEFKAGEMDDKSLDDSGGEKRYIPIKEMLQGLRADPQALGYFIQRLNNIDDADLPSRAPVWKAEDLNRAFDGDQALQAKLVKDLNVKMDGDPLPQVSKNALFNGIVIDSPVPMRVAEGDRVVTVDARVKRPFRVRLLSTVEARLSGKLADDAAIASEYAAAVQDLAKEHYREDLKRNLGRFLSDASDLSRDPQRVLDSIKIILNENQIVRASMRTQDTTKGTSYTLVIELNDEGRKRIWQYTRDHEGVQLLVTVNGVAISAPSIGHAISSSEVEITGIGDESIAQNAVDTINSKRALSK